MANFFEKFGFLTGRIRRVVFGVALVIGVFSASNSFAAGYTCNTKTYSSCSQNYYLNGSTCSTCPSGCTCAGGTAAPVCTVTCNAGQYLNGSSCASCTAGNKCTGGTWTPNGSAQGLTACSGTLEYQDATGATSCKTVTRK